MLLNVQFAFIGNSESVKRFPCRYQFTGKAVYQAGDEAIDRYLNGGVDQLYDPRLLPDMDKAVGILEEKISQGAPIRIVGDYDIDGVCSTCILFLGLKRLGARVDYEIPDRIKDGYGINESIILAAKEDGIDTILTCDNGIAAISQIALAKELGMAVVVTDHHDIQSVEDKEEEGGAGEYEVGEYGAGQEDAGENAAGGEKDLLPPADVLVNPKRRDSRYPFSQICGAMVAYKLIQANQLDPGKISVYHIGFVIGPCLNAGGRLQTAKLALALLLAKDQKEAWELAAELKALNDQRKDMTQQGVDEAAAQVEQLYMNDKVLVIFLPDCHESLAGIVAGRIRERYNKPVFVLTRSEEGSKGSGRSIEAYHMFHGLWWRCRTCFQSSAAIPWRRDFPFLWSMWRSLGGGSMKMPD